MKFYYYDHQGKGKAFHDVLIRHGWTMTRKEEEAEFAFVDTEINRREQFERFNKQGKPIFIYPHAARPDLLPDFDGYEASPFVTAHFVSARGHAEIMDAYGYPSPMPVVGWTLCSLKPFSPRKKAFKVLFAPIHSSRNGTMSTIDKEINIQTFKILHDLVKQGKIDLTVRYLYNLKYTGLEFVDDIAFIKGNPDHSTVMIDVADVVVSHQTFAHLSVARGVPTVMMGENRIPRYTLSTGLHTLVRSWEKYKNLLMYPLDILCADDPYALLVEATQSDEKIKDWLNRMIGDPFDGEYFYQYIMEHL
jgi:hypothetical protein